MDKKKLLEIRIPLHDIVFVLLGVGLILFGNQTHEYIGYAGLLFYGGCNTIANDILKSMK